MNIVAISVATLLICSNLYAVETLVRQDASTSGKPSGLQTTGVKTPFSLLDPARFHMSQSYSLNYVSSGNQSRMIGMYINQIDYELAKPLQLSFAIGWLHQPQTLFGSRGQAIGNKILPSFRLSWEPSKYFHFMMRYETRSPYLFYDHSSFGR